MKILKIISFLILVCFMATGCLELATSNLKRLVVDELLENDSVSWEFSGDCLVYKLNEKHIRVFGDGSICLFVETASGLSAITISNPDRAVAKKFLKIIGHKKLPISFIDNHNDVKEDIVYATIKEIGLALTEIKNMSEKNIEFEKP